MTTTDPTRAASHRLVPLANLTALLALLPPKPVEVDGKTFAYHDPNAAERLLEIRDVFDTLLSASPLATPPAPSAEVREKLALIIAGLLCDATKAEHSVMRDGRYSFCTQCGETITKQQISITEARNKADKILSSGLVAPARDIPVAESEILLSSLHRQLKAVAEHPQHFWVGKILLDTLEQETGYGSLHRGAKESDGGVQRKHENTLCTDRATAGVAPGPSHPTQKE